MGVLALLLLRRGRGPPEARLFWSSGPKSVLACHHVGIDSDKEIIGRRLISRLERAMSDQAWEEGGSKNIWRGLFLQGERLLKC